MIEKIRRFSRRARARAGRARVAACREVKGRPTAFAMLALVLVVAAAALALSVAQYGRLGVTSAGVQSIYIPPSGRAPTGVFDAIGGDLGFGNSFQFVEVGGNDGNDCHSVSTACRTIAHAISVADAGDTIFVGIGSFDESPAGVTVDKSVSIVGRGLNTNVSNSSTANGTMVVHITAPNVELRGLRIVKGETAATGVILVYVDGVNTVAIDDTVVFVASAAQTGMLVEDALGFAYRGSGTFVGGIGGISGLGLGTGLVISNSLQAVIGDVGIGGLGTCVRYTGAAGWSPLGPDVQLTDCTVPVQLDPGSLHNSIAASVTDSGPVVDNSGNDTNTARGSLTALRSATEHSGIMFPGTFVVVDGENGIDTNSGFSPSEAVATIGRSLEIVEPGDGLVIRADGIYTEQVQINTNAVQVFAAPGVIISGTNPATPTLHIHGNNVWVRQPLIVRAPGVGVCVDANEVRLEDVSVELATTAFDLDGGNVVVIDTVASGYSEIGYDLSGALPVMHGTHAGGTGAATSGYVISSTVSGGVFRDLSSVGNGTIGYSIALGATDNTFIRCTSGTGDGALTGATWLDPNLTNMRVSYDDQSDYWHHEEVYPATPGDGTAVDLVEISSVAVQDRWGPSVIVADVGAIPESWRLAGLFLSAGNGGINMAYQFIIPQPQYSAQRDGGNAWSVGATVLTLDGSFQFAIGDLAWVRSSTQNEIVTVVNITGATLVEVTPLVLTHPGDPILYAVERPSSQIWSYRGFFSDSSAKGSKTLYFHAMRQVQPGGGLVGRLQNLESGLAVSIDAGFIYER